MEKLRKDKRGQVVQTLMIVGAVILVLLTLAVTYIAVNLALTSLQNAGIFTANSQSANQTNNVINNITTGGANFFSQVPTIFTILGIVALIGAIVLIIYFVARIPRGSGGGGL